MAFGSPLGAMLVPFIGWRGLFLVVGAAGAGVLLRLLAYRRVIAAAVSSSDTASDPPASAWRSLVMACRACCWGR